MKKLLVLLAMMLLVTSLLSPALAYDDEITFQGIPWGCNSETLKEYLSSIYGNDIISSTNYYFDSCRESETKYIVISGKEISYSSSMFRAQIAECSPKSTIGGYDIGYLQFWFYVPKAAKLDQGKEMLQTVGVYLKYGDKKTALKDLTEKLSILYGKSTKQKDSLFWFGSNNTFVTITNYPESLNLAYGIAMGKKDKTPFENWMSVVEEATPETIEDANPSDLGGL